MKNILIPTDFSTNAWNALQYAVSLFKEERCTFYLLHVSSYEVATSGIGVHTVTKPFDGQGGMVSQQFQHLLGDIKQLPTTGNHSFVTLQEYIYLVDSIRKVVAEHAINYIIMGTKGASGLKEKMIGSNAGAVITRVKCPTLVIPEKATHTRVSQIAFPTDYNISYNSKILDTLSEILDLSQAHMNVLTVLKSGRILTELQQKNKELLKDALSSYRPSFHFSFNRDLETGVQHFVKHQHIDMIAMVAKNLNFFQRILFHPTIELINYHTSVPFLVLHE